LLTGATGGLGRELCFEFARRGARLVISSRSEEKLEQLAGEIMAFGGRAVFKTADVSVKQEVGELVNFALRSYNGIDVLVNNAGIAHTRLFSAIESEAIEKEIRINYLGPVFLMKEILPLLLKQRSGQIINISSLVAFRPFPLLVSYSATKAALSALTDALRIELQSDRLDIINVYLGKLSAGISQQRGPADENRNKQITSAGMSPETAAKKIISAAGRNKKTIHTHPEGRLILWINSIWPGLLENLLYRLKLKANKTGSPNSSAE